MSISQQDTQSPQVTNQQPQADPQRQISTIDSNSVQALSQLLHEVQTTKVPPDEAKLNETTISDGSGGRIDLNDDPKNLNRIKK